MIACLCLNCKSSCTIHTAASLTTFYNACPSFPRDYRSSRDHSILRSSSNQSSCWILSARIRSHSSSQCLISWVSFSAKNHDLSLTLTSELLLAKLLTAWSFNCLINWISSFYNHEHVDYSAIASSQEAALSWVLFLLWSLIKLHWDFNISITEHSTD